MANSDGTTPVTRDRATSDSMESLMRWALSSERAQGGNADIAERAIKNAMQRPESYSRRAFLDKTGWRAAAAGVMGLLGGAIPSVAYASTLERVIAEAEELGLFNPVVLEGPHGYVLSAENAITVSGHAATELVSAIEVTIGNLEPLVIKPASHDSTASRWKVHGTREIPLTGETLDITVRAIAVTDGADSAGWLKQFSNKTSQVLASPLGLAFANKKPMAAALTDGQTVSGIEYVTCTSARDGWFIAIVENTTTGELFHCTTQQVKRNQVFTARMDWSAVAGMARVYLGFSSDESRVQVVGHHQSLAAKPMEGIDWFREVPLRVNASDPELRAANVVFSLGGTITVHSPTTSSSQQPATQFASEEGLPQSFLIQTIAIPFRPVSREAFRSISNLNSLQGIIAAGCGLTNDVVIDFVGKNRRLKWICFNDSNLDDVSVKAITELKDIESLEIADTLVSDSSIDAILSMRHLTHLDVRRTKISPEGIAKLRMRFGDSVVAEKP